MINVDDCLRLLLESPTVGVKISKRRQSVEIQSAPNCQLCAFELRATRWQRHRLSLPALGLTAIMSSEARL